MPTQVDAQRACAPKRKRQTYAPKYRALYALWDKSFRAQAVVRAYTKAASAARSKAIESGDIEFPTEPTPEHVGYYRRAIIREYRRKVTENTNAAMGRDAAARRRAQGRNSKLRKSAQRWQAGERSQLYDTTRKLMTPEERDAHDREKDRLRKARSRAAKKVGAAPKKKKIRPVTKYHPNFGMF